MTKEILNLKEFVEACIFGCDKNRKTVRVVEHRENNKIITKFKLRGRKYLQTYVMRDREKAKKLYNHLSDYCDVIKVVSAKRLRK